MHRFPRNFNSGFGIVCCRGSSCSQGGQETGSSPLSAQRFLPDCEANGEGAYGRLTENSGKTLATLASDFSIYRQAVSDAHLVLEGHADVRGSVEYNQALTERRVAIVKSYLVSHGVPEDVIEIVPLGAQHNLTPAEVKASVETDPELSQEDKGRILKNMRVITLASNRRVDVTLKAAGMSEKSKCEFPFNGADSLTLLGTSTANKASAASRKAGPKL